MEEQDYIELNTLLAKLRVVCLKEIGNPDTSTPERQQNYTKTNAVKKLEMA